jgi:hypothetical protein
MAQPQPSFLSRVRPSEANSGPADTLPLCVPRTCHPGQPARLTPPFNSHRPMLAAEPGPASLFFPSLFFYFHMAQWPASDEPSLSYPWRPCQRTRAARPRVKKSSPNQIKTDPHSNPTTLRDRVPVAHIKDPKIPIYRTPLRRILAQNRAQTLEAPVVPSPRHCKPSPVGSVPRQPSTTSTAPT